RLSSFPLPSFSVRCQSYSVRSETLYASFVAAYPYVFQNLIIFALSLARSVTIYANRIAYSCAVREPLIPLFMLKIRMILRYEGLQYVSEVMQSPTVSG